MNRHVNTVTGRLSLRPPQRASLEVLARIAEILPLQKDQNAQVALEVIRSEYPQVADFERSFPSLCFALATGVGKTRLMGAFITYLHLAHGVRHFFVLAPNLTIYNKLIADFTPNTPKYVFQGIAEFALDPPEIVTGENYESGRAVRSAVQGNLLGEARIDINIFNIAKIDREETASARGGKSKFRSLQECIGQSYHEYLAGLDDLVILMDESHRYRGSAGWKAINSLKPILGLELTATPQLESSKGVVPFKNVIYSYPLANAIADGFVKEPAVATRENFNATDYKNRTEELEQIKLEDGIHLHESVKVKLEVYSRQHDRPLVKPFMLVVARDTDHAGKLDKLIKSDAFFDGRYQDRVITVHSNQSGQEKDETVQKLLAVESPQEKTEIVIHVNMLKEGWDVTNLYTIVPLRPANSRTLVEQSIGRGLRLPYGKRTGVPELDRVTIVAHDKFQDIIDEANKPDSVIRNVQQIFINPDRDGKRHTVVTVEPSLVQAVTPSLMDAAKADGGQPALVFPTPAEQQIAQETLKAISDFSNRPTSRHLEAPEMQKAIRQLVEERIAPVQPELDGVAEKPDVAQIIAKTTRHFVEGNIDIPRIIVVPKGEMTGTFQDFDLDARTVRLQPVSQDILIEHLSTHERQKLSGTGQIAPEERLEDYLVRELMDYDDISYDDHADLLYKLASQMVDHLRSYLTTDEDIQNVAQYHAKRLAESIYVQMEAHYQQSHVEYEAKVSKGFLTLRAANYEVPEGEKVRNVREPVAEKDRIREMLFTGFQKSLYPVQRFDSDPERRLSVLLENDSQVLKWVKPPREQFQIFYSHGRQYEPDFVVETVQDKYIIEPKRSSDLHSDEVKAKAKAAHRWCQYATEHAQQHGAKPWHYLLVPHDEINYSKSLQGLVSAFKVRN